MGVPINYLAVLAAAIANMVIGSVWYGPLFGKQWLAWSGMTMEKMTETKKKGMGKSYALMFVGSLVMYYVLAHALVFASAYLNAAGPAAGAMAGFWNWLGFIAPVTLGMVLWDGKPWKLWVLTNGYQLVALVVGGVILGIWQ